jgi:hypothetical protein
MAKRPARPTQIDRAIADIDNKIAALQLAREHLVEQQARTAKAGTES